MLITNKEGTLKVNSYACYKVCEVKDHGWAVMNFDSDCFVMLEVYNTKEEVSKALDEINAAIMRGDKEFIMPTYEWQFKVGES